MDGLPTLEFFNGLPKPVELPALTTDAAVEQSVEDFIVSEGFTLDDLEEPAP